ncbi:MAG: ribulose-bisphosphate carboxylase large [Planctomycetota bacterium]|nr:MAG: ribulose-bisphosphate carboxylase large [Planctomycetota bacterium]
MTADAGFFADASLDRSRYLLATNVFETDREPREAAAHLAQEQSTAQWKRPGVDEDFRPRHGAKVVSLKVLGDLPRPSAPTPFDGPGPWRRCEAVLAHAIENFGAKIPTLLSVLLGEGAFYAPGIAAIRLTDIALPDAYAAQFPGPQFGVKGLRELLGVRDRPFFIGVVKPNIGLSPAEFAALAEEGWRGGLDAAKDDEMLPDTAWSPLADRARLCGEARKRAESATGERKLYVANITDEIGSLRPLHDNAVRGGANALLLNSIPLGLPATRYVREFAQVPIFSHFAMSAALTRGPSVGVDSSVLTLLQRLAGGDVILFPGTGARMRTTYDEVRANIDACRRPLGPIAPSLPVPGGSSRPPDVPATMAACSGVDFGLVAGRAVFNHPGGPASGARSFRQAWAAVQDDISLEEKARTSPELARSLETFRS